MRIEDSLQLAAGSFNHTPEAETKAKKMQADTDLAKMGVCMVKTHLSLTDNPNLKGMPKGWRLMPGTSSDPAYRRVDVDVETGKVKGVF